MAVLPATAAATFPGRDGMLVALFSSYPHKNSSNMRGTFMGIEASGQARRIYFCTEFVGNCGDVIANPSISSNGRELAFDGGIETDSYINQDQITVLRFGKFGLTLVPFTTQNESEMDTAPAWIPGRNAFVFSVGGLGKPRLDSESPTGAGLQVILHGTASHAAVSPSGRTVLYDNGPSIWSVGIGGGTPTEVVSTGSRPDWAPNGKRIAYASGGGVYVASATGIDSRRLAPRGTDPVFSPDGKLIAYAVIGGQEIKIYARPAGGGSARLLLAERVGAAGSFGGMDWQALGG